MVAFRGFQVAWPNRGIDPGNRTGNLPRERKQERIMPETLEAVHWGPASKASPKQLVVLCHGLGADAYDDLESPAAARPVHLLTGRALPSCKSNRILSTYRQ